MEVVSFGQRVVPTLQLHGSHIAVEKPQDISIGVAHGEGKSAPFRLIRFEVHQLEFRRTFASSNVVRPGVADICVGSPLHDVEHRAGGTGESGNFGVLDLIARNSARRRCPAGL